MKEFNKVNEFKNLKFRSVIPQDILQAVSLLEKLGYEVVGDFSSDDAAKHNGFCAWDDGEITEGWSANDDFEQVTLEDLKEMVSDDKEVLWLNRETLEEKCLNSWVYLKGFEWVKVPDGATFATGDKGKFVFRKDGFYYEDGEWIKTELTFDKVDSHPHIKLFWVKSDVKDSVLSNNFTVAWEQVFGEKFADSVSKAVKQNKDNTMKNDTFTLKRLLGCEVLFGNTIYYVIYIYYAGAVGHLVLENDTRRAYVSDFNLLTFFTEDGGELTFTEYVEMYYGDGYEERISRI